ncbi:hypothetical protein GCM10009078_51740 [Cupriavidus gilardii]|nr:hypothetical protein QWJ31_19500 [Cupriavidus gilardii]
MATIDKLINLALKDVGVIGEGQTPSAETAEDALMTLNQMIAQWQTEGIAVYAKQDISFQANGALSYTIGAGGNVNIPRPVAIEAAFWRNIDVDYPLRVMTAFEDYQRLGVKTLQGVPAIVYYRPDFPLGELFIWPQPDYGDIHVTVRKELPEYLTVGDEVSLPREYEGAIRSNLAVLLCAMHGSPLRPDIQAMAVNSKRAIKRNNSAIPMAKLPPGLLPNGRYNIYGDMVY